MKQRIRSMDFSSSPLGFDDGHDLSRKNPILMDFIEMLSRIFFNKPNV